MQQQLNELRDALAVCDLASRAACDSVPGRCNRSERGNTPMNYKELRECYEEADRRMKRTQGHSYFQILKVRCQYCSRSPRQKGKCAGWFQTFLDQLSIVLGERGAVNRSESL